ncbi:MAG: hypothetical protein ACTMHG_04745 [Marinobacter sp.]
MKTTMHISGEEADHKLAAECVSESEAEKVAEELCELTSLDREQVQLVEPGERHQGARLEPEDRGIWHTAIRAHVWLALVGMAGGLALFLILVATGIPFVAQNMIWAGPVLVVFGGVAGLLLGGAFTLRPDHTFYVARAESALDKGRVVVTVHARDRDQLNEAEEFMESKHIHTMRSL